VVGNYDRRLVGGWQESMDRCLSHQQWIALHGLGGFCAVECRSQWRGDSDAGREQCILLLGHIVSGRAPFSACRSDGQFQRVAAAKFLTLPGGNTTLSHYSRPSARLLPIPQTTFSISAHHQRHEYLRGVLLPYGITSTSATRSCGFFLFHTRFVGRISIHTPLY
jgi:hypothetical protein